MCALLLWVPFFLVLLLLLLWWYTAYKSTSMSIHCQWSWNRLRLANTGKSSIFTHIHKITEIASRCLLPFCSYIFGFCWFVLLSPINSAERLRNKGNNSNNKSDVFFIYLPYLPAPYLCIPWNFNFTFAWDRLHSIRLDSIFHILFLSVVVLIYRRAMQMKKNERPCLMAVNHNRLNMNQ